MDTNIILEEADLHDIEEEEHEEEEEEHEDENDFYDLSKYVNSNRQLSRGLNLRTFLEEHFNVVSRRSSPSNVSILMTRIRDEERVSINTPRASMYEYYAELENVERGIVNIDLVSTCLLLEDHFKDDICPICQGAFSENESGLYRKLKCTHLYCDECIGIWLSKSKRCPVCKLFLDE